VGVSRDGFLALGVALDESETDRVLPVPGGFRGPARLRASGIRIDRQSQLVLREPRARHVEEDVVERARVILEEALLRPVGPIARVDDEIQPFL